VELDEEALLGEATGGFALLDGLLDVAAIAGCAEALGCMQALIDRTAEYLRTREQFGRKIGDFQVLQHALVDMYMATEQARSITLAAALKADASGVATGVEAGAERRRLVAAARQVCAEAGRLVGQTAVQLHGGIGVTDELDVAHYFKRLTMLPVWFADNGQPLDRFQAAAA
jgi:alkylation response protein AidB-like acyl-CoA dehydrogenase